MLRKLLLRTMLLCVVSVSNLVFGGPLNARNIEEVEDIAYYKELVYPNRERHYLSIVQRAYSLYASGEEIPDSLVMATIPKSRLEFWQWTLLFNSKLIPTSSLKNADLLNEDFPQTEYREELKFYIDMHSRQMDLSTRSLECFVSYLAYARYTYRELYNPDAVSDINELVAETLHKQVETKMIDRPLCWYEFFVSLLESRMSYLSFWKQVNIWDFYWENVHIMAFDSILKDLSIEPWDEGSAAAFLETVPILAAQGTNSVDYCKTIKEKLYFFLDRDPAGFIVALDALYGDKYNAILDLLSTPVDNSIDAARIYNQMQNTTVVGVAERVKQDILNSLQIASSQKCF